MRTILSEWLQSLWILASLRMSAAIGNTGKQGWQVRLRRPASPGPGQRLHSNEGPCGHRDTGTVLWRPVEYIFYNNINSLMLLKIISTLEILGSFIDSS